MYQDATSEVRYERAEKSPENERKSANRQWRRLFEKQSCNIVCFDTYSRIKQPAEPLFRFVGFDSLRQMCTMHSSVMIRVLYHGVTLHRHAACLAKT